MPILRSSVAAIATLLAILLSNLVPQTLSADPSGGADMLAIANVASPDVLCLFTSTSPCVLSVVEDMRSDLALAGTNGLGFLQSRILQQGAAGTEGANLYPYIYRINFSELLVTVPPIACVNALRIPFGRHTPLDYDNDGSLEDIFVVTSGGEGGVGLSVAYKDSEYLYLTFDGSICPQTPPGNLGSFMVGVASSTPPSTDIVRLTTSHATFHYPEAITMMQNEVMLPMVTR